MIDNEGQDDREIVFELEEASQIVNEVQTTVVSTNACEALRYEFLNFPCPKVTLSRADAESRRMEQMALLKKMDPHRLKEKPENENDFCAHECKCCGMLMKFQWKA